jgi:hypothetical protein
MLPGGWGEHRLQKKKKATLGSRARLGGSAPGKNHLVFLGFFVGFFDVFDFFRNLIRYTDFLLFAYYALFRGIQIDAINSKTC